MKLALNDPIWDRLYGPYGVVPVAEILAKLDTSWEAEIAQDLLWVKLHHQETLYPVTYAALPWLFDIAKRTPEAAADLGEFFSQVVYCASLLSDDIPPARFCGLSTIPSQHHHSWIDPSQRLRDADAKALCDLERWFEQNKEKMADFAVGLCKLVKSEDAGHLLRGYAALAAAFFLVSTLEVADGWVVCPACGNANFQAVWHGDIPVIQAYAEPENYRLMGSYDGDEMNNTPNAEQLETNWKTARKLADLVRIDQPKIAAFLDVYSTWRCCKDG